MREIGKMCYNPQEEDVVRAKNQLKAAILFSQDNLSGEHVELYRDTPVLASC